MASSRIQRWAITLSAYRYSIRYKKGQLLGNADALSRLPRPVVTSSDCVPEDLVHLINHLSTPTVTAGHIRDWTTKDPVLSQVRQYLLTQWPSDVGNESLKPYKDRHLELSTLDECIMWGSRIITPPKGREPMLQELHDTHPGASKMKALAQSYLWWPGMDAAIEEVVKSCVVCQKYRPSPPQLHHFTHGSGQNNPGAVFTWTLQVLLWVPCFS